MVTWAWCGTDGCDIPAACLHSAHNDLMIGPCPTDASESGSRSTGSSQDSAKNKWVPLSARRISPPSDVKVQ